MPISFRNDDDIEELGQAGYLKVETCADGQFLGALFLVNARGEPVEFTYTKVETPSTFLWRQQDIRSHAVRTLVTSLFSTCPRVPKYIVCLAGEINHQLFCDDVHVSVPVCRIASTLESIQHSERESAETEMTEGQHGFWFPQQPVEDSAEHRLFARLASAELLLEPFVRASIGLREVYKSSGESNGKRVQGRKV